MIPVHAAPSFSPPANAAIVLLARNAVLDWGAASARMSGHVAPTPALVLTTLAPSYY